jgi:ABC-type oligopeptide transport system ATPase subunit
MTTKEILQDIANNWCLEARDEDNLKYYYTNDELDSILKGRKFYVIGRKGSGKTAISEHLLQLSKSQYNCFAEKLSFKHFPFNDLYNHHNARYTPPNQYITIWKYLIYSYICRLMIKNESIDNDIRQKLSTIYSNPLSSLERTFKTWTSAEFGATVLGTGGNVSVGTTVLTNNISWQEKTDILEDIIMEHLDASNYYVIFDELDEDYGEIRDEESYRLYSYLLTSLFKAVQDIKSIFKKENKNIIPVIFLRDDIYSIIKDADKTKWNDFLIEIDWNIDKIKKLLAYRISKSMGAETALDFDTAWHSIFSSQTIGTGTKGRNKISAFEAITRNTHFRPRDYVAFIQQCAKQTLKLEGISYIMPDTIKKGEREFSNYFMSEIRDEIIPVLPDIDNIYPIMTSLRKWNFTINEFKDLYNSYVERGTIKEKNIDYVLQKLFHFSIIGNQDKRNYSRLYFKYQNRNATINYNERIVIHRGLFKALQIDVNNDYFARPKPKNSRHNQNKDKRTDSQRVAGRNRM